MPFKKHEIIHKIQIYQQTNKCTNPVSERLQDAPDFVCGHVHAQLLPGFSQGSGHHVAVWRITFPSCEAINNYKSEQIHSLALYI